MKKQGKKLLLSMVCIIFIITSIITFNPGNSVKSGDILNTCGEPVSELIIE